jgi:hypothetical protein
VQSHHNKQPQVQIVSTKLTTLRYPSSSLHKATQQALQELQNPKLSLVEQSQYFEKQIKV